MEETKQERISDKYYDEIFGNIDELKEKFIHFYGEKYRKKIENLFKITDFIIIPKSMEMYKLLKHIHKNFPNLEKFNTYEVITFLFIANGAIFENDQKKFVALMNNPIVTTMGINFQDYVSMTDGQYSWKSDELKNSFMEKYNNVLGDCDFNMLAGEMRTKIQQNRSPSTAKMDPDKLSEEQKKIIEEVVERIAKNHEDNPEKAREMFDFCMQYFVSNAGVNAFYRHGEISEKLQIAVQVDHCSFNTIMHELNHLVQTWIKKDEKSFVSGIAVTDKLSGSDMFDFTKLMEFDSKTAANEMINEYLTQRLIEEEFSETKTVIPKETTIGSEYLVRIELFNKFLKKWEPVLKDIVMGKDPVKNFQDAIGVENFEKLISLCHYFSLSDEKMYLSQLTLKLDIPFNSFEDVLKHLDEIKELGLEPNGNLAKYVRVVQQANQMSELLAEHFEQFTHKNFLGMKKKPLGLTDELANQGETDLYDKKLDQMYKASL